MDKILVIQDSLSISIMLKSRLEAAGFAVDAVETGEEGVEMAQSENYQLALVDYKLPGMNGGQVCNTIRHNENTKKLPLVFISAKGEDELKEDIKACGADGFVSMPFHGEEFIKKIKAFIEKGNK
ncbi:MAG: response regulator transcription factor [bacterium]